MENNILKLKKIAEKLIKIKGSLLFMGLVERHDVEDKWDLLISGDWVESGKSERDLIEIINELKAEFVEGFDFISQILTYKTSEPFIQHLALSIKKENPEIGEKIKLKLFDDFVITTYIIYHDFENFDITYVNDTKLTNDVRTF